MQQRGISHEQTNSFFQRIQHGRFKQQSIPAHEGEWSHAVVTRVDVIVFDPADGLQLKEKTRECIDTSTQCQRNTITIPINTECTQNAHRMHIYEIKNSNAVYRACLLTHGIVSTLETITHTDRIDIPLKVRPCGKANQQNTKTANDEGHIPLAVGACGCLN